MTELYLLESGTVLYTMEVEGDDSDEDDDSDADGGNASGDDDDEEDVSKTHLSDDDESKTGSKISDDDGSPMILRPSMQTVARASLLAVGTSHPSPPPSPPQQGFALSDGLRPTRRRLNSEELLSGVMEPKDSRPVTGLDASGHSRVPQVGGVGGGANVGPEKSGKINQRFLKTAGTALCDLAFFFGVRQPASIEAYGTVSCLSISASAFNSIKKDFGSEVARMKIKALEQAKQREEGAATAGLEIEEVTQAIRDRGQRMTDVMFAAAAGEDEAVKKFFEEGDGRTLSVDDIDYEGRTALMIAASHGRLQIVNLLLSKNASVNILDRAGKGALDSAVKHGHIEISKILRAAGARLSWDMVETAGELCEAARNGEVEKLSMFLDLGADVNAVDYDARSCLHLASACGNEALVKMIVKRGGNVRAKDRWGHTPLREALRGGRT